MPDKIIGKIRSVPKYSKLRDEYFNFYKTNRGDDYFDEFYKFKTKDLPKALVSRGPGWIVDPGGEFEQFFPAKDKSKVPTGDFGKPLTGKKVFVENYKEYDKNPLDRVYHKMILDLQAERLDSELRKKQTGATQEELRKKITPTVKPVMVESMIAQLENKKNDTEATKG